MGDSTTCVYQFIDKENDNDDMKIIQYFIMHGLGICINLDSYVAHMLCACSFIHNTTVPIAIMKNKWFLSLNTNTTVFSWGSGNFDKNWT